MFTSFKLSKIDISFRLGIQGIQTNNIVLFCLLLFFLFSKKKYIRPCNCAKFVLKYGMKHFFSYFRFCRFHKTDAKNIENFIKNGFKIP